MGKGESMTPRAAREADTPWKNRYNVCIPLLEDEMEHLERLAKATGLKRYQVVRQALMHFTPDMIDIGWKNLPQTKREMARWETQLALEIADGNRAVAGTLLGISRSSVLGRIRRYSLDVKKNRAGRPSKKDREELTRRFHEHRNLRLFGRERAKEGGAGAPGGG